MSDFIIQQGTDASYSWPITNEDGSVFDPTNWSAKIEVKGRNGGLLHTFSTELNTITLTTADVTVSWFSTDIFDWSGGRYDLYVYTTNKHRRLDAGYIIISPAITTLAVDQVMLGKHMATS